MNLLTSISVAAFAINLFIAVFVLAHDRRRIVNQLFFLCGCCLAAWSLATFVLAQPVSSPDALRWARLLMACSAIAPVFVLHLIVLLCDEPVPPRRLLPSSYAVAVVLAVASLGGVLDAGIRQLAMDGSQGGAFRWYPRAHVGTWLLPANALAVAGYGMWMLLQNVRNAAGIRGAQAYYFMVGLVPALLAGMHDFAGGYIDTYPHTDFAFAPAFPLASAFWAGLVGYTLLRYRLIDLDAAITRGMVRTLTLVILVIPFFLLLVAAQQAYHGEVYLDFSMLTLAICVLAAFIVPRLSAAAERKIGRVILGPSRNYREALVAFSGEAARILDLEVLTERVAETMTSTLGVSCAAVYVAEGADSWRLGGQRGCYLPRLPEVFTADSGLVDWLRSTRELAVREELAIEAGAGDGCERVVAAMDEIGAELAIPLTTPEELEGIVLLGAREDGTLFTEEDLGVLTILGNQLATALSNARLYADLKRSRELIQRSDRLSAIGTMAAGLAHEIRNPLVSIRTFTQLLPERFNDAEFCDQFFDLTLSEVDRICALINELLAFARPAPAELQRMDVNDCLSRICLLIEGQARGRGVRLEKHLSADPLELTADEDQIKQVVMNVVLNAIQACDDDGTVEVWSYPNRVDNSQYVCIEITDDGGGISQEILDHIFDPFFTTRREGTGLGLSIAHQIVTRHGGFIDVRTDGDKGTCFYINLPIEPRPIDEPVVHFEAEDLRLHG